MAWEWVRLSQIRASIFLVFRHYCIDVNTPCLTPQDAWFCRRVSFVSGIDNSEGQSLKNLVFWIGALLERIDRYFFFDFALFPTLLHRLFWLVKSHGALQNIDFDLAMCAKQRLEYLSAAIARLRKRAHYWAVSLFYNFSSILYFSGHFPSFPLCEITLEKKSTAFPL